MQHSIQHGTLAKLKQRELLAAAEAARQAKQAMHTNRVRRTLRRAVEYALKARVKTGELIARLTLALNRVRKHKTS